MISSLCQIYVIAKFIFALRDVGTSQGFWERGAGAMDESPAPARLSPTFSKIPLYAKEAQVQHRAPKTLVPPPSGGTSSLSNPALAGGFQ